MGRTGYAHIMARMASDASVTVGAAREAHTHTLNFGETASVILTTAQLAAAQAAIASAIDQHMAENPPPPRAA